MKKQPIRCGEIFKLKKDKSDRITLSSFNIKELREQIEQEYHEQIDLLTTENTHLKEQLEKFQTAFVRVANSSNICNRTATQILADSKTEILLRKENERLRKLVNHETD